MLETFLLAKTTVKQRLDAIKGKLDEQARLNRALRLGRVPRLVARMPQFSFTQPLTALPKQLTEMLPLLNAEESGEQEG